MGLFEQFPYTNFHELNLDWLIEQINMIKETAVLSVNGESGDVILYKDPIVRLPDITADTWNIFRYTDGTPVGIQFKKGSPLQRIDNLGRYDIYDANNPPPYPVTAVNGQTGDVVISIPVQSVNGMTGNIILYQQASVELPALESGDTWRIWRETESNAEVGIKFTSGQPMKRVDDGNEYAVYDTGNPPPYPVTSVAGLTGAVAFLNTQIVTDQGTQKVQILFPVESVDGLTGTVRTWAYSANETLKTPIASEGDRWSLARECPSGDVGIRFTYDSNNGVQGYLVFSDGQNPESALRILTPADIPSSSGVVSINGQTGVVVLHATDIQMASGDTTTIPQAINNKAPIESLAIPIVGNVASQNVDAGKFVFVKNSTITGISDGLYIAVNAISANTPFTSADLTNTDTAEGGLNALNSKITTIENITDGLELFEITIPEITIGANSSNNIPVSYFSTLPKQRMYVVTFINDYFGPMPIMFLAIPTTNYKIIYKADGWEFFQGNLSIETTISQQLTDNGNIIIKNTGTNSIKISKIVARRIF